MASSQASKTIIRNANVFDGTAFKSGQTVAFANGHLVESIADPDVTIDAEGAFLLPGLIDCHVHVHSLEDLGIFARFGVTTCLDMGARSLALIDSMRGGQGTCDVRSPGMVATAPGSRHSKIPGFPKDALLTQPDEAIRFVEQRVGEGADYIKVMTDNPGPDQATVNALVTAAHEKGKQVVAHATSCEAWSMAVIAGVDVVTHVPMEQPLGADLISQVQSAHRLTVPTLVKMLATAAKDPGPENDYSNANESVRRLKDAQITILAGTDANKHASGAGKVPYGESMCKELELLVDAGLSPLEALQGATHLAASSFGLTDRGAIAAGNRADLLLVSGNPLENISNLCGIQRVWCGGIEVGRA